MGSPAKPFPYVLAPVLAAGLLTPPAAAQKGSQTGDRAGFGPPAVKPTAPDMVPVNGPAGLGSPFTDGNGHTGGCAWVDYNGDYWADLFVTNGADQPHYLYRNDGDGTFTPMHSLVAKPDVTTESAGVACADIDNDGDTDILVAGDVANFVNMNGFNPVLGGPNMLYVNQGNGTFIENAQGWGLVDPRGWRNMTVNFADIDNDGFIDVYMGAFAPNNGPTPRDNLMRKGTGAGFNIFSSGTAAYGRETLVALFWDADFDLDPDLYVGNVGPFHNPPLTNCNDVYYDCGAGGSYTDVTSFSPGIADDACGNMGMDVGDIDNDGDWDLYITDIDEAIAQGRGNDLYLGDPSGTLSDDVANAAGVRASHSWPCNFEDFDRDGWVDLWVGAQFGTGKLQPKQDPSWLFMNNRDLTFTEHVPAAWYNYDVRGGSTADYDGDGDMDVFMQVLDGVSQLYRCDARDQNAYLQIKLIGQTTNRDAIGAVARVTAGGITQMRRVSGGESAHSQRELILHFGLGRNTTADIEVLWPSGVVQNFTGEAVNQLVIVDELGGLQDQSLVWSDVRYDKKLDQLEISAWTNYRGRTKLALEGYGPLAYDVDRLRFHATFALGGADVPRTVYLTSDRGKRWKLPVDGAPRAR